MPHPTIMNRIVVLQYSSRVFLEIQAGSGWKDGLEQMILTIIVEDSFILSTGIMLSAGALTLQIACNQITMYTLYLSVGIDSLFAKIVV